MTEAELESILLSIELEHPGYLSDHEHAGQENPRITMWMEFFGGESSALVFEAVKRVLLTSSFPPKIADVKREIDEIKAKERAERLQREREAEERRRIENREPPSMEMSIEEYQKDVVVGKNKDGTPKLESRTYVRATREYRRKYEEHQRALGLRKAYVNLGNGKRGHTWEKNPDHVPGSETAKDVQGG